MSRNHMEVCHLWASGNKADAKGFNIYFEGREIYSYGPHFMLGFKMGPALFFLNSSSYSISTGKHKSYVWRAAHGEIFHVPNLAALRHELRTVARFREGKADKADARRAGARMIETLAPMIADNAGAWEGDKVTRATVERLALESGFTARQAATAIDKAAGAAARKAAADAKRKAEGERAAAIAYARKPMAETVSHIAENVALLRGGNAVHARDALHTLERYAKEAARKHRIASKAAVSDKTRAALWAKVKAYRAALADHERKAGMRARLASFESHKAAMRANLAKVAAMPDSVAAPGYVFGVFRAISTNATLMRNVRFMRPATSAALSAIIRWADERNEWEAAESARIANAKKAAEIVEWRNGGRRVYFDSDHGGAAIRATGVERDASGAIIGGTLETSHGASVPLAHAIRVFRFLKLMRERGEQWHKNSRTIRVGHYTVDRVESNGGFTAGCHRFAWPEIEALAVSLGVFDISPADVREPSQAAA